MDVKMGAVDSQQLLIQIFKCLEPEQQLELIRKIDFDKKINETNKKYIYICEKFGSQIRITADYCNSFDKTCKRILIRQGNYETEKIRKKDYITALGWKNGVQLNRIEKGDAEMQLENIQKLCSCFTQEAERRFWTNQLIAFFPETFHLNYGEKMESDSLLYVIKGLNETLRKQIEERLSEEEKIKFLSICDRTAWENALGKLGKTPRSLYKTILNLEKNMNGMTIERLAEEELGISRITWYTWKTEWERAEMEEFTYLPKPRLKRNHLLIIAMVCHLNYLETLCFLQSAGYCLGFRAEDTELLNYFLFQSGDAEELKRKLRKDIK